MKQIRISSVLLAITFSLCSCGGGGGGGGGSSSTTGVRVLHAAIEATPIDLNTDSQPVSQTVRYGEAGDYLPLGEGQHLLQLGESKGGAGTLYSKSITNPGDQKFTLLFYGDRGDIGLRTALIEEPRPIIAEGTGIVRVIHGAVGASSVSLVIGSGQSTALFGGVSTYVDLAPAVYPYTVRRTTDRAVLAQGTIAVGAGEAYSIFVAGEQGYLVSTAVLLE